jgi:hypothetical protein
LSDEVFCLFFFDLLGERENEMREIGDDLSHLSLLDEAQVMRAKGRERPERERPEREIAGDGEREETGEERERERERAARLYNHVNCSPEELLLKPLIMLKRDNEREREIMRER